MSPAVTTGTQHACSFNSGRIIAHRCEERHHKSVRFQNNIVVLSIDFLGHTIPRSEPDHCQGREQPYFFRETQRPEDRLARTPNQGYTTSWSKVRASCGRTSRRSSVWARRCLLWWRRSSVRPAITPAQWAAMGVQAGGPNRAIRPPAHPSRIAREGWGTPTRWLC